MPQSLCGNGFCDPGETSATCPEDCPVVECQNGETRPCSGVDIGQCDPGFQECVDNTWGPCQGQVGPSTEVCDGIDKDCDGVTDEGVNDCPEGTHCVQGNCVPD